MQIPKFKCRSSSIGLIMTEPKGKSNRDRYNDAVFSLEHLKNRYDAFKDKECKSALEIINVKIPAQEKAIAELALIKDKPNLSETTKTFLKEWIISEKYGRKKEFTSKFTEKGCKTEQDGFQLIQEVVYNNEVFLISSKDYLENEYRTGHIDTKTSDTVIDNKSSFTLFTFPFGEEEIPNINYVYQIQSYMDLLGLKKGKVCFTLNDSPFEIVADELKYWCRKNDVLEYENMPEKEAYEIIKNHVFSKEGLKQYSFVIGTFDTSKFIEIPKEKRVKPFDFEFDEELISRVDKRIVECREWINENWHKF